MPHYPQSDLKFGEWLCNIASVAPKRLTSLETNKMENTIDVSSDESPKNHGLVNLISIPGKLLNHNQVF